MKSEHYLLIALSLTFGLTAWVNDHFAYAICGAAVGGILVSVLYYIAEIAEANYLASLEENDKTLDKH